MRAENEPDPNVVPVERGLSFSVNGVVAQTGTSRASPLLAAARPMNDFFKPLNNSTPNAIAVQPIPASLTIPPPECGNQQSLPPGIQWKTKAQIAAHFTCHIRTMTKYMKRRILPFVKIGRWVRFDLAACDKAMKKFERRSKYDD